MIPRPEDVGLQLVDIHDLAGTVAGLYDLAYDLALEPLPELDGDEIAQIVRDGQQQVALTLLAGAAQQVRDARRTLYGALEDLRQIVPAAPAPTAVEILHGMVVEANARDMAELWPHSSSLADDAL